MQNVTTKHFRIQHVLPHDGWIFVALLVAANVPLLFGGVAQRFLFVPSAVCAGEYWRVLTHAFVHVSPYHFLLDATAFLTLYSMLGDMAVRRRLACAGVCVAGSLAAAWSAAPSLEHGFCGMSGAAHGLMAAVALGMATNTDRTTRIIGIVSFVLVAGKAVVEALTGNVVLGFLHVGSVGLPVAVCHAGGALAGVLWFVQGRWR